MKQLNCQLYNRVLIIEYEIVDSRILCNEDICINGWSIDKRIILYGGTWMYDPKSHFEFVVTDPNGISKIFKLYSNVNNKIINVTRTCCGENWILTIKDFIENCTIWKCQSWDDALTPKYQIESLLAK